MLKTNFTHEQIMEIMNFEHPAYLVEMFTRKDTVTVRADVYEMEDGLCPFCKSHHTFVIMGRQKIGYCASCGVSGSGLKLASRYWKINPEKAANRLMKNIQAGMYFWL